MYSCISGEVLHNTPGMSKTRYTTALAHLISTGASIWAIKSVKNSVNVVNFPFGSFGAFLIHSVIGVLTFGK